MESNISLTRRLSIIVWQHPAYFIAFGFGSGLLPIFPGTWGTVAAIPLYLLLVGQSTQLYLAIVIIAFVSGIWITQIVSQELGEHDYGGIVWDEIVGYLVTMLYVPFGWQWLAAGFVLFRVFDIWKPQPIRYIDQRVTGGFGIMLDDVLAAVPAWLIMQCLVWGFAR
jgi:phosphatidylglycerophosphatase A